MFPRIETATGTELISCAHTRFNDGYHVIHHIKPGLHWTMLPQEFENTLAKHADEGALVRSRAVDICARLLLGGCAWLTFCCAVQTFVAHFMEIGVWAFTNNWKKLIDHSVHLLREGEKVPSYDAQEARLKAYLRPLKHVDAWVEGGLDASGHAVRSEK